MALLDFFKTKKTQQEEELLKIIRQAPASLEVLGHGTIRIAPEDVVDSTFNDDLKRAARLVRG